MTRNPTIWEALAARLGRKPTNAEANAEARRILREGHEAELIARAERGALPHQRKRASI
jgi:hypothetical protein